jgi:hypothetical protein
MAIVTRNIRINGLNTEPTKKSEVRADIMMLKKIRRLAFVVRSILGKTKSAANPITD